VAVVRASVEPGRATLIEDLRRVIEPATTRDPCAAVVGVEKPRQGGGRVAEAGHEISADREEILPKLGTAAVEPHVRRGLESSRP